MGGNGLWLTSEACEYLARVGEVAWNIVNSEALQKSPNQAQSDTGEAGQVGKLPDFGSFAG